MPMIVDYSQFGEQQAILAHTPRVGRFLDIGAYDAEVFSNTRALFENGWGGVLVEPHPKHARRLRSAYSGEPRVRVVQAAVGMEAATALLRATDDAVSTLDARTWEKWDDVVVYDKRRITVMIVTLEDLYEDDDFAFVNIDAEGWSVPIFLRLLDLGHRPDCICVEYDDHASAILVAALDAGYHLVLINGTNLVVAK